MLESFNSGKFEYKRIPIEELKARGILGRLTGVIADTKNATRNGRLYSQDLWRKVFDNEIMKEKIANRCVFSELGHPTDREEVDLDKVCACLAEQPKIGSDGKLYGVFDILDTANGRILKTLCDYGTTVGISSRGTGDLYTDENGNEAVDPDSYNCECFDIVIVPAVKSARLTYVNESLDKSRYNKTLRQSLKESLNNASSEDRKIMKESLEDLGVEIDESVAGDMEQAYDLMLRVREYGPDADEAFWKWMDKNNFSVWDIDRNEDLWDDFENYLHNEFLSDENPEKVEKYCKEDKELNSDKDDLKEWNSFQDYYKGLNYNSNTGYKTNEYASEISKIQEDSKEKECNGENCSDKKDKEVVNDKSSELVAEFQESLKQIKKLKEQILSLQEKLSVCNAKEANLKEQLSKYKEATIQLSDSAKRIKPLKEKLQLKSKEVQVNKHRVAGLKESVAELKEEVLDYRKDLEAAKDELHSVNENLEKTTKQLGESKELVNKYRKSYNALKESYLDVKVNNYGLNKKEVLYKLGESYKIKDINNICEELSRQKRNMNKLPFSLNENTKINIKETKVITESNTSSDDYVSDSLLRIVNLK